MWRRGKVGGDQEFIVQSGTETHSHKESDKMKSQDIERGNRGREREKEREDWNSAVEMMQDCPRTFA